MGKLRRWFKRNIWWRFTRRESVSLPGEKLPGTDASDTISIDDLGEGIQTTMFRWSTGLPAVKAGEKYWCVITRDDHVATGGLTARKFTPVKNGVISSVGMSLSKTGNQRGNIRLEVWTDIRAGSTKEVEWQIVSS